MDSIYSKHGGTILSVLKSRQKELIKSLRELPLFIEWEGIMDAINEIEGAEHTSIKVSYSGGWLMDHSTTYNMEWSLAKKAEFVLRQHGRGLGTGEIADKILQKEPAYKRSPLVSQISAVLLTKYKAGKVFTRRPKPNSDSGEFIYELKEWQDVDKMLQPH